MDKFFIQNAFKTLDEIETEINNKENLQENLKEDLASDFDTDELQDKYLGLGCSINDPASEYVDDHGSIQSLVDFEGSFEDSIWKVTLDTGISINVPGKSLTVDLDENLPKDLSRAYMHSAPHMRDSKDASGYTKHFDSEFFPTRMQRRWVSTDFKNSNYTEISPEEAIKKYSKKGERSKLRALFDTNGYPLVMMWDDDNVPIIRPQKIEDFVNGNVWSFKDVIRSADKIYVTDEAEHKIERKSKSPVPDSLEDRANKVRGYINSWTSDPEEKFISDVAFKVNNTIRNNETPYDTGDHSKLHLDRMVLKRRESDYKQALQDYKKNPDSWNTRRLERTLQQIQSAKNALGRHGDWRVRRGENINLALGELVIVKYLLKKEKEKFENTQKGVDFELKYHPYRILTDDLADLNKKLKEITGKIAEIKAKLTPELEAEYAQKLEDKLFGIGDQYTKLLNDLKRLRGDTDETKTDESLNEDVEPKQPEVAPKSDEHLRIYTINTTGYEDFIDADWDSTEKALDKAKEVAKDTGYTRVCLIKVKHLPELEDDEVEILFDSADESQESDPETGLEEEIKDKRPIGEIVDDIVKNESLTESKAFNLKDENDVVDALAYKGVGEKTDEELVVVDPSIESEDEEYAPHAGNAILQCKECKTSIFIDTKKLEKDDETDTYNKDMACPHCGAKSGFLYLYQVAEKEPEETPEEVKSSEDVDVKVDDGDKTNDNLEPVEDNLEPVENDFIDLDEVDEIQEESFEKLVNPYLTKLYENIKGFKVTDVNQTDRKTLKVEGKLISSNDKEKLVEFLFTIKGNNANSIVFEGYNKLLTEDTKAFNLKGKLDGKSLVFESFEYKYNKNVDDENILIEGIEKINE